jgi:hypothetical protein
MQSLVIHTLPGSAPLPAAAVVGLPAMVESAGWILSYNDRFRVWINRPKESRTLQFDVTPSREIEQLDSLPLVGAGAAACGESFIVTGADHAGLPVVAGTDANGQLLWLQPIEGPPPFRWPAPGCSRNPIVLWQMKPECVEVADVGAEGVTTRRSFAVGGPPLDLEVTPDSAWAVWADASGVCAIETSTKGAKKFQLSEIYASEIAIGCCAGAVCVAWGQGAYAFLARKPAGFDTFEKPLELDISAVAGGVLRVIPGDNPLIHVSRAWLEEGQPPQVLSILTGPDYQPLAIEGVVHSTARKGDTIVLLGMSQLVFLGLARN